ncbi:hypothetical protein ES319_A04G007400v1 [Gossypium barbadense]|uniref:Tryptophan synthase beta chain-like PALP domain-containing protein n=1 Tax=Gossypium barbadense TaxID=3634 RepID=A0A5J5W265_GOSBA|nr:hypothetical protein ES319_A04G007400v1 [Gossypium barbadense]
MESSMPLILGKCEFLNPGGSVKDRVALKVIEEALESGDLAPGGVVTEGSAGSTAISLATVAPAFGCKCHVVIPDDAAIEKSQILEALGATVERVRPVSITHKDHFVNIARRHALEANELAAKDKKVSQVDGKDREPMDGCVPDQEKENPALLSHCNGGFFANQFENLANFRAHYEGTGLRFGSRLMAMWMHLLQLQALVVPWLVFLHFFRRRVRKSSVS